MTRTLRDCMMSRQFRETGAMSGGTFEHVGTEPCGNPVPETDWGRGPWMCDECKAQSARRSAHPSVTRSYVPMAADVLAVMQRDGVSQDEAVRRLGGTR